MPSTLSLAIPTSTILHVTHEQFEALAAANPDLRLERTAKGELIAMPPTGGETGQRNLSLTAQLGIWSETHEDLGIAFDSSTGFVLPNGATLSPDAAWVSRPRWEALTLEQRRGFPPLCPDFVAELRSASDRLSRLQTKMQEYLDNGVRLGWLIDPQRQQVEIYRSGRDVEVLDRPIALSGEDVLPEFGLNLRRIWG